ncbi:MAG: hypothetical protein IPN83_10410 [Holophagales bacterium]|nr:hypothetical protein [Holophagales bacterium]
MAFAIVWAEVAVEDLDEVADFIARDSRYYASAMVRGAPPGNGEADLTT